jgi:predicted kinase
MRKWVSDRLKRRKKKTEEKPEATEAPLQPAYFEEAAPEAPVAEASKPAAVSQVSQPEGAEHAEAPAPAERTQFSRSGGNNPARGKRRRGGRSNRGRGQSRNVGPRGAVAQSPVEPASDMEPAKTVASISRPPKGVVVLAIGLPGSGKSSWFKRHNITPLSSDMLRALLFDDPTEQRFQDLIFSNLRSMLKARLIAHRPMNYVDTTNLTPHDRHSWIKLAKDFGFEVQAVFFEVPLEVCLERNQKRERVVPEEIMRRFAEKLKAPTFEEGFSKITVVRVKQKEASAS